MKKRINIIGAGLAGSQAALTLSANGYNVRLYEMRPLVQTDVHRTDKCAELVCSNSLKSTKQDSAAGMLKYELEVLNSRLYHEALVCRVPAGGALAVNREEFSESITSLVESDPSIELIRHEVTSLYDIEDCDAMVIATGPLTGNRLAHQIADLLGQEHLAFYDAAAPIVSSDTLDFDIVFSQSRYEEGEGDYLNAPFTKEEYNLFIEELLNAQRVVAKDFETRELFQACQPIEEIARKGTDAPRFGCMKPVGLIDPRTGKRPWAALQLRAEDKQGTAYNLVGFQTNLTFPEQERVFKLIPGLGNAEFYRHGVMHRNTFINAPKLLNERLECSLLTNKLGIPVYAAGQFCGTEGYVEAIRSGLHAALSIVQSFSGNDYVSLPQECVFGALIAYAVNPDTVDYQPSHVNFGLMPPLDKTVKNKGQRYAAFADRGNAAIRAYAGLLKDNGVIL